jgi:phage terminase large subunit
MWRWIVEQFNIADELTHFPSWYMGISAAVLVTAITGLYFHYTQDDNRVLSIAIVVTLIMAVYERYGAYAYKSSNLTVLSAVIYTLLMI